MIYLVSNIHRSGSSMMIRCLEAGGLDPEYNRMSDLMNNTSPMDYIPNPNGFYQFTGKVDSLFYDRYNGKVLKCYIKNLLKLPEGEYKLLILRRKPEEIRASMAKWTPFQSWGMDEVLTYFDDMYFNALIEKLSERKDIEIISLNYADIVKDPQTEFQKLVDAGWPINAKAASEMVDPELHRFKLEQA